MRSSQLGITVLLLAGLLACEERRQGPGPGGSSDGGQAADSGEARADSGQDADASAQPGEDSGVALDAAPSTADAGAADDAGTAPADAGEPDAGTAPVDAGQAALDAGRAAGCGRGGVATGIHGVDTMVNGLQRHYQVYVPPSYDPQVPLRLVFTFHGLGGNGDQIRSYLSLETESAGQAIIVYPDGRVVPNIGRTGWEEADLGFFDAMLSEVSRDYCVDLGRVFATGHSFGGYMTNLVGCQRGDIVKAVAPVSGGTIGGVCRGPVAAWLAHGDNDPTVPQSEGIAAREQWRQTNGCSTTTAPTSEPDCQSYQGCPADAPVTWCSFSGGHYPLPAYTRAAIWEFFRVR